MMRANAVWVACAVVFMPMAAVGIFLGWVADHLLVSAERLSLWADAGRDAAANPKESTK